MTHAGYAGFASGNIIMACVRQCIILLVCLLFLADLSFSQDLPKNESPTAAIDAGAERLATILDSVRQHEPGALEQFRGWRQSYGEVAVKAFVADGAAKEDALCVERLEALAALVERAEELSGSALSNPEYDKSMFHDLIIEALALDRKEHSLAVEAVESIGRAWKSADALVKIRDQLFEQYQDEANRGKVADGTRLAWSLIRIGAAGPDVRIKPGSFVFDDKQASIALSYKGADVAMTITGDDYRKHVRAAVDGYNFRTGWTVLFQKPIGWMAAMAKAMREAGVAPEYMDEWDVMEAPEGLIALGATSGKRWDVPMRAFYRGALRAVESIPPPEYPANMLDQFRSAAERLAVGVMGDEGIPMQLRQALKPILEGTYKPVDPRDYFDGDFCRRLIEADYLESQVPGLSAERRKELADYRETLAKIELGLDRFAVDLLDEGRLVAVTRPDLDSLASGDEGEYRDPESGETVSRYQWRWERDDATLFHSPLPARYLYADSLLEHYDGKHTAKPAGTPKLTEVWHATFGRLAAYRAGDDRATGDAELWRQAVVLDARGRKDTTAGPLGWNFPLFVPVRDDQGDPVLIATLNGVVESPDFSGVADEASRREEQEKWLDRAARVLATPGELALLYQIFFRYCSDSPLPEQPNLIGSHYALSDTHQTVYQSLERRWVGRLIGDCDDLAEFFQNLCDRQGKLSHVMQLPAHAAAGYLDEAAEGGYEFVVLQTGPVLRFVAETRVEAVEKAYRHFDEAGGSHFTAAAVPLLLRFGGEDTRTAFVLPARIYWDRDYATKMITVQSYWHLHTFTAAIAAMEDMLKTDREVGNLKELASLYERVGEYAKSDELRHEEYEAVGEDELAALSTLLDLAQLQVKNKDKAKALENLDAMEEDFREWRTSDAALYERAASFRYSWATLLSRLSEPEKAWRVIRHDVEKATAKGGGIPDALLRTLVAMYNRMAIQRDDDGAGEEVSRASVRIRYALRNVLADAFGEGYFKKDDSNNKLHSRYFWLGRYGVAVAGRRAGLESLWRDGPYPSAPRAHADRKEDLSEADWEWFRIMPRLYLAYGVEMLDRDDYPELYDPAAAERCLSLVGRAMEKGAGFGSDVMGRDALVKSELILAFIRNDLAAFRSVMTQVRGRDYASLYDDAATVFGTYCGLVPAAGFAPWIEAFHEFFPGRQNYFKAAYRALDKEYYNHAVMLARATAGFFPDDALLVKEAEGLEAAVDRLRRDKRERGWEDKEWARRGRTADPSAAWLRDIVEPVR